MNRRASWVCIWSLCNTLFFLMKEHLSLLIITEIIEQYFSKPEGLMLHTSHVSRVSLSLSLSQNFRWRSCRSCLLWRVWMCGVTRWRPRLRLSRITSRSWHKHMVKNMRNEASFSLMLPIDFHALDRMLCLWIFQ